MSFEFRKPDEGRGRRRSSAVSTASGASTAPRPPTDAEKFKAKFEEAHPFNAVITPLPEVAGDSGLLFPNESPFADGTTSSTATTISIGTPSLWAPSPVIVNREELPLSPTCREDDEGESSWAADVEKMLAQSGNS